ncbi:MAG TPA: cell division protein FtsZ [Caldimonas sp.]|nr:cell division protein FtsZ [Caldimonas sp.]
MSSLTVALAALGGLVLAGVIAHGAWTARRAGPKRASEPRPAGEAREPVLADVPSAPVAGGAPVAAVSAEAAGPALDVSAASADPAIAPAALRAPKKLAPRLDALIDALATLAVEAPVSGDHVLAHLPTTRRVGSKVLMIEGLNAETGEWEPPVAGERYSEFQAGVQLANRTGALNEIEYSEFVQRVQAFADAVSAMPDVPDMLEAMARARELDSFAGQHDAQLALRLHARAAAWSVGYIQQHARQQGFIPGSVPGRLVRPSAEEGAPPVLTLTFDPQAALSEQPDLAAVRDVTLAFDVPQTDPSAQPFAAWQASAQSLATAMDADVVDDDGRPLTTDGFAMIGRELETLYASLAARELAAGSPAARRLFS